MTLPRWLAPWTYSAGLAWRLFRWAFPGLAPLIVCAIYLAVGALMWAIVTGTEGQLFALVGAERP